MKGQNVCIDWIRSKGPRAASQCDLIGLETLSRTKGPVRQVAPRLPEDTVGPSADRRGMMVSRSIGKGKILKKRSQRIRDNRGRAGVNMSPPPLQNPF